MTTVKSFIRSGQFLLGLAVLAAGLLAMLFPSVAHAAGHKDPYKMANNTWISLSGSVESIERDSFLLNYGDGTITIEMDDGDRDADAYNLRVGDKVIVTGVIDDDFYELTTIEASSVFVENLGTTFFASPIDDEVSEGLAAVPGFPVVVPDAVIYGTVTEVNSDELEFTIDSGIRELDVEVDSMPYNPLDDEGYQKIRVGDRVKIRGMITRNFFEGREIEADYIIKLRKS